MSRRLWLLALLLVAIHLAAVLAGFVSPYDPTAQDREHPYAPPVHLHWRDAGGLHLRPFVFAQTSTDLYSYADDRSAIYPLRFLVHGSPYSVLGVIHSNLHFAGVDDPATLHLLGTDGFGRDVLARLLYGGQISLLAGLLATAISLLAGALVGGLSGFYGGWADESLMGCSELFLALPWLYLLFAVRAFLPLHLGPGQAFLLLIAIIGMIGWARPARLVRGLVLSGKTRNYVLAARGFGASDTYLLRRHILPETAGLLLTQSALLIPQYIAAEASLSFFGLGVSEPTPSWGNMLSVLQQYNVLVSYWWLLAPAVALLVTSVTYGLIASALQQRLESATA
ncbi:MAG TPA: ABC transporter permease [Terriglobales bacterium]|nr:ABC transporter permease [Terriglobales bacterium]